MTRTVDKLQKELQENVFHYAKDSKKAAGRALGTFVEIITYYKVAAWGFRNNVLIERRVPEFGDASITHNVEFSIHKSIEHRQIEMPTPARSLNARAIGRFANFLPTRPSETLLCGQRKLRNAAVLSEDGHSVLVANLDKHGPNMLTVDLNHLHPRPVAIFECKRVGVEEGMKKGPQSIEKAKQGAYVAKSVSALQKVFDGSGNAIGYLPDPDGGVLVRPYQELFDEIVLGRHPLPPGFVLSVGVTSNHGNWFTADNHNKELKVLAHAYDWLLFLTDAGLMDFVDDCLLRPKPRYQPVRDAFIASYAGIKGQNRFTKVKIDLVAAHALLDYFEENRAKSDAWFEVITPRNKKLPELSKQLESLLSH
jgi:hypothetical protein